MSNPPTQADARDPSVSGSGQEELRRNQEPYTQESPPAEQTLAPQKRTGRPRTQKTDSGGKKPGLARRRKAVSPGEAGGADQADMRLEPDPAESRLPIAEDPAAVAGSMLPDARPQRKTTARKSITNGIEPDPPQADADNSSGVGAGDEGAARKRSRRGKRSGKGRNHKSLPQIRMPLEIAAAITALLALPPGRAKPKKKREKGQQDEAAGMGGTAKKASKTMLISVMPGEQVEAAIVEDGVLLEYYLDMLHQRKIKGNIYKGIVHNIDANLQAAFVDYGAGKNGFLQIDQVHPEYWQSVQEPDKGKKFPPIQKILKIGQELLVQVVKEPAGSKGAFLTTWLSLAGRFLVLTPGQEQIGVSRKVSEPEERNRLREMMNGIDPGKGFGVIVRTVGEGANKTTLKNDLQYLKRLWREIRKCATEVSAPAIIHQEPGLPERSVRDYLTEDVGAIWVDDEEEAVHVRNMASLLYPRKKDLVHFYENNDEPIWDKFHVRTQLSQLYDREVFLPSGGRLVFDQTEALMAIDINSGRISGKGNFENMAFKTNMEAAESIARQLRLRDVGGQVVIDFIEMRDRNHVVEVEKCLRQAMKNDRAKHDVARMSSFGLLELVRQRMGSSALSICLETCPVCNGTGMRRNMEWHAQQSLGELRQKLRHFSGTKFTYELPRELGMYMLNQKREALRRLEEETGKILEIAVRL